MTDDEIRRIVNREGSILMTALRLHARGVTPARLRQALEEDLVES